MVYRKGSFNTETEVQAEKWDSGVGGRGGIVSKKTGGNEVNGIRNIVRESENSTGTT